MASHPTPIGSVLNKGSSSPKAKEEEHSNAQDDSRTFNFDEFTRRAADALKSPDFTEALHFLERELNIRFTEEDKSASWFLKTKELYESCNKSVPDIDDSIRDIRSKFKNHLEARTNEIVQKIPDDNSEEKELFLSFYAEADKIIKNESLSDCSAFSALVNLVRDAGKRLLNASFVSRDDKVHFKTILDDLDTESDDWSFEEPKKYECSDPSLSAIGDSLWGLHTKLKHQILTMAKGFSQTIPDDIIANKEEILSSFAEAGMKQEYESASELFAIMDRFRDAMNRVVSDDDGNFAKNYHHLIEMFKEEVGTLVSILQATEQAARTTNSVRESDRSTSSCN